MFSEILKIIPRLENGDLNRMENSLTKRFGRISKKFGKGLVSALAGGGVAGLALGLIDKLLNPLKETQEAIDRVLKQGDDIVTNAKQFGTTAGKLFKLQQVAASTGLEADSLFQLITKFQTAVAEAKNDPTKQTSVRQFTQFDDTAEGFFNFIQSLQKMSKDQQLLVQQEVFGEKQILKMADFLQTDFGKQLQFIGARPSEEYTPRLEKLGALNDLTDILTAKRTLEDTFRKADVIQGGMITQRDRMLRVELERENERIRSYKNLATISEGSTKLLALVEKAYIELVNISVRSTNLSDVISKMSAGRMWRGILGIGKDN